MGMHNPSPAGGYGHQGFASSRARQVNPVSAPRMIDSSTDIKVPTVTLVPTNKCTDWKGESEMKSIEA